MALKLDDKKAIVAEVNEAAGNALSAVVADYRVWTLELLLRCAKSAWREDLSPSCSKYSS